MSVLRGDAERCELVLELGIRIGSASQKIFNDVFVALLARYVQRRRALAARGCQNVKLDPVKEQRKITRS